MTDDERKGIRQIIITKIIAAIKIANEFDRRQFGLMVSLFVI